MQVGKRRAAKRGCLETRSHRGLRRVSRLGSLLSRHVRAVDADRRDHASARRPTRAFARRCDGGIEYADRIQRTVNVAGRSLRRNRRRNE